MNLNLTLVLQSIAMMIFVWFCMKFIWPPLMKAMDERRARIADGLAASDRAERELEEAKKEANATLNEARSKAGDIVEQANQRHNQIMEQAKEDAVEERQRQVSAAESDIALAKNQAREELRESMARLVVLGASKILEKDVDETTHRQLIDELIADI